jgi:hypothetical protein
VSGEERTTLKGLFSVHLVKLDGRLFFDIYPKEPSWGDNEGLEQSKWFFNAFFNIPAHTFLKVESIETQLKIWFTNIDEFKKLLQEDPNAVKHEMVDGTPVLTGSTPRLQSFVLKYADDKRVFSGEHLLSRKSAEPNAIDVNNVPVDANEMPV